MTRFFLVVLGGAAGTAARHLTSLWAIGAFGATRPAGTLIVNVIGSFLMAFVMHLGLATDAMSDDVRIMITTGFMGGFTTYSAFNYETAGYFRAGAWFSGVTYVSIMLIACLVAGAAGLGASRLFTR
jgi:CrcB protein